MHVDELNPQLPHLVDSTQIVTMRACWRSWYYQFCLGLRAQSRSVDLVAGGAFAAGIDGLRTGLFRDKLSLNEALVPATRNFLHEWGDYEAPEGHVKSKENVLSAIPEFCKWENPLTDPVQPHMKADGAPATEFTFSIPLPIEHPVTKNPWLFGGRFDMLGTYNGMPCIVDEKTTKSLGSYWLNQFTMRSQFLGYCWACQQLKLPVNIAVINGVGFLKKSTNFLRAIQQYPQYLIDRWYIELLRTLEELNVRWKMYQAEGEVVWSYNFGDTCTSYGGCQFTSLCASRRWTDWLIEYNEVRWDPTKRTPLRNRITEAEKELTSEEQGVY